MTGAAPGRRGGRAFEVGLSLYGAAVFAVLWGGLVVGLASDGVILEDAWAWLTGLETLPAVVAWVLFLPIAVGLWAWNEAGSAVVQAAVAVGLVAWTALVVNGLVKTFGRRGSRG